MFIEEAAINGSIRLDGQLLVSTKVWIHSDIWKGKPRRHSFFSYAMKKSLWRIMSFGLCLVSIVYGQMGICLRAHNS